MIPTASRGQYCGGNRGDAQGVAQEPKSMTTPFGQIPLLMRQEGLANWDNWLSRKETSTLESLLTEGNTLGHGAYIWGTAGIGKSHVLQACCDVQREQARYFPLRDFVVYPPEQVLAGAESARVIALDDVDAMDGHPDWQEALFGLFNLCQESGSRLLVTASRAPQQLAGVLPDLRSRLSSLPVFQIPRFDEEQVAQLLTLRGDLAGLQLAEEVVRYCAVRLRRNPRLVVGFVDELDKLSLAQRRAVTVPFVRESGLLHQSVD